MTEPAPRPSTICFLTKEATSDLLHFINQVHSVGQSACVMTDYDANPPEFECLSILENQARRAGFWGVYCVDWIPKTVIALDKALFYFGKCNRDADYVWFVEDDVFVPRPGLFHDIDAKYPDADLLTKANLCQMEDHEWPGWERSDLAYLDGGPYYHSICCAMRLSRRMLDAVVEFAETKGRLVFQEFFFNTLAMQKGFKVETPEELGPLLYEQLRPTYFYDTEHLYHSIKDISIHSRLRELITSN